MEPGFFFQWEKDCVWGFIKSCTEISRNLINWTYNFRYYKLFPTFLTLFSCDFPGVVRLTPNIALGGTATQSSTYIDTNYAASPFVASHAIDGNVDNWMNYTSGACSRIRNTPPVWWQVDLRDVYEINRVAITAWSRTCKCQVNIWLNFYHMRS